MSHLRRKRQNSSVYWLVIWVLEFTVRNGDDCDRMRDDLRWDDRVDDDKDPLSKAFAKFRFQLPLPIVLNAVTKLPGASCFTNSFE